MANLSEDWKPSRARMVLTWESHANRMVIHVDGGRPDAWRKEPYYAQIKRWAEAALRNRGQRRLGQRKAASSVLPDRELFAGRVGPGQAIAVMEKRGPEGVELFAQLIEDPAPPPAAASR